MTRRKDLSVLKEKTDVTFIRCSSKKLKGTVRAVVLADLHDEDYGEKMERITDKIRPLRAGLILIPGDLCEEKRQDVHSSALLDALREMNIPVFYSTGNHEEHRPDLPDLLRMIRDKGVCIPESRSETARIGENELEILSLPCVKQQSYYDPDEISSRFRGEGFRILLSHRPSWTDLYSRIECDLVVSGHAHGGQWRLPGGHRGLIAPSEGFLPAYTEGKHDLGNTQLVISRGLTKTSHGVPRLFNHPEILVLDLCGEETC